AGARGSGSPRGRRGWVSASREDPEGLKEGRLDLGEAPGHREEIGWRRPRALEPAPERLDGEVLALLVAEPERVDDAALGAVDAQGQPLVDFDGLAANEERVLVEAVPADRGAD